MKINEYSDPSTFLSILENDFSKPFENELMIGLTSTLLKNPNHYQTKPFLSTIEDQGNIKLAAFLTPPWPIVLYSEDTPSIQSLNCIIEHLENSNIPLSGVNAKNDLSSLFSKQWSLKNNCSSNQKMKMALFVLNHLNPIEPCNGYLIEAEEKHFDLIYDWALLFQKDINLNYENEFLIKKHVEYIIKSGNAFLWVDGDPVSMVFRERTHNIGFSIGYVYTPDNFQRKGYATNNIYEVCKISLNEGYLYSSLLTDLENPISNHIYKKIGFNEICEYQIFDFKY